MNIQEAKAKLRELVPDFAKRAQPIYQLLGWEWQPDDKRFVPQIKDIEECLYGLIDDLDNDHYNQGTGGLRVEFEPASDFDLCDNCTLSLRFEHSLIQGQGGSTVFKTGYRK